MAVAYVAAALVLSVAQNALGWTALDGGRGGLLAVVVAVGAGFALYGKVDRLVRRARGEAPELGC